jgi:hypothetical protein
VPAKSLLAVLGVSAVALSLGAVAACSGTTSDTTPTITGVLIRAETLTAGRGCGVSPSQVYKYAAVVFSDSTTDPSKPEFATPLVASVFDCFADGAFVNLPAAANQSTTYKIELYVYDEADFTPKAGIIGGALGATPNTQQLRENAPPTWSTTCYATQVQDVQSLAVCDPIQFGLAGVGVASSASVRLDTASFALEEGGSVTCALVGDGGAPDGGGSGDAGDAGADAAVTPTIVGGYGNVRVTPSAGSAQGTATTVRCPQPYVLDPALPLQTYSLNVEVFSPDGTAVVGRTTCSATARPGLTAVPTCAPLH